jgi:mediator of RNA polymerase II transcription subunit 30
MSMAVTEKNPFLLCRLGQDTLQEVLQKTTEIFSYMRAPQLPNGVNLTQAQYNDRKSKLDEPLRRVEALFARLRHIYDTVNDLSATVADPMAVEELLPIEDSVDLDDQVDTAKPVSNEEKRLIELIRQKNQHLKTVIDQQRMIIWEINTMMAMRTSPADKA